MIGVRLGAGWSLRERLFAVITWCPKATVQAALAGVALDHVTLRGREGLGDEYEVLRARAELLLTTGVLSILLTAPLFAVLMWCALPPYPSSPPGPPSAPAAPGRRHARQSRRPLPSTAAAGTRAVAGSRLSRAQIKP